VSGAAKLAFTTQPGNATAGSAIPGPPTVTVQRDDGSTENTSTASITVAIKSGTGTAGATLGGTTSVSAVNGVATFTDLSLDKAGTGYQLTATSSGLTSADSGTFDVAIGTATKLAITTQPSTSNTAVTAFATQPAVAVQDAGGNTVAGAGVNITLAIKSGTGTAGAILSGTTTVATAASGIATFSDLSIDKAGTGYILRATSGSLTAAESNALSVEAGALHSFLVEALASPILPQTAGAPFNIKITAQDRLNNTVTSFTGTVDITSNGTLSAGSGTTAAFTNGVLANHSATFSAAKADAFLTGTKTGGSESGTSGTSTPFTVNPAGMNFLIEAAGGGPIPPQMVGTAFSMRITARNADNTTKTDFTGSVTLTSNGTLTAGGTTTAFVAGVLASHSVTISSAQTATTLTASDGTSASLSNSFTVNPGPATTLSRTSGNGQSGPVETALASPFVVTVTDADGRPIFGRLVTFAIASTPSGATGQTLSATSTATDGSGQASSTLTLGSAVGTYTVTATSNGLTGSPLTFTATATGGALHHFAISTISSPQTAGTPFSITITAEDASNHTVTSFTGTVNLSTTAGTISPTTSGSFSAGVRTESVTVTAPGSAQTVTVSDGNGHTGISNPFTVNPGPPAILVKTAGDFQSALVRTAFPTNLQVLVRDSFGNNVADGTSVTFVAPASSASGAFAASGTRTTTVSTSGGLATASVFTANSIPGSYVVSVNSGAATEGFFLTNIAAIAAASKLAFTTQPGDASVGSPIPGPPTVTVQDQLGNTVTSSSASITVSMATNPAGGALSGTTTVNATGGVASFTNLSISQPGIGYTLAATSPGLQGAISAPFNVIGVIGGLARFAISPIPSPQRVGVPFTITISALDASNKTLTSFTGRVALSTTARSITPSTSGVFANGVRTETVTVTQAGTGQTISVSDGVGHGGTSNAFEVVPEQTNRVAFVILPGDGTVGLPIPGPPTVAVQDSAGNILTGTRFSITIALGANPAGGTLSGTQTKDTIDGVARFDDLTISKPGSGYTLIASATGLSSSTSPGFKIVNPGSVPAELNGNPATLVTDQAASFTAGDELVIRSQSRVRIRFRRPSVLALRAVTPLVLELRRGEIDAMALDISLRFATPHGEVRADGTAELRLIVDAETTLEVHSGSAQYLQGGATMPAAEGATKVPAGGRVVANASGILSTELRLTQPLLLNLPGLFTLLSLSNPTSSPANLTLTALDMAGNALPGAANPRTVQVGPGGLLAELTTSLFGLDPAAPAIGSIRISTSSLGVQGASFAGDTGFNLVDSAGLTGRRLAEVVISEEPAEFLALVNPGEQPLSITVARFGALGNFAGEIPVTVPAGGVQINSVDDLLGPPPPGGRGSLRLNAPDRFTAFAISPSQQAVEAPPVESIEGLGDHLVAPIIMDVPGALSTTLTLVNASSVPIRATIRPFDATGKAISGAAGNRVFAILPAGAKGQYKLRDLFKFSPDETTLGWLEVLAVPTVPSTTVRLMGTVQLEDPQAQQFQTSLPMARAGQSETTVPFLFETAELFSFIALLNPSQDQIATVTLEAVGSDGTIQAYQQLALGPRTTFFGLVRDLLPELSLPFVGSLHVRSEGAGITVSSIGGHNTLRFLTVLPSP
jgi:hypothetical protein